MKKIISFALLVFAAQLVFSQTPMNGTYTIGGSGTRNYSSFTQAVVALQNNGVNGPVTFDIEKGRYYESLVIQPISGASATNRIIFQSKDKDTNSVWLVFCPIGSIPQVLHLDGADFISFKYMTFTSDTSSCTFNYYKEIVLMENTNDGIEFIGNRFIGSNISSHTGNCINSKNNFSNNFKVIDNSFYYNDYAIRQYVALGLKCYNVTFSDNRVFFQRNNGVNLSRIDGLYVNNNLVINKGVESGMSLSASGRASIYDNIVYNKDNYAFTISNYGGKFINVYNNYFKSNDGGVIIYGDSINFYNNTIISNTNSGQPYYEATLEVHDFAGRGFSFYNNILINTNNGLVYKNKSYSTGDILQDYNVYYGGIEINNQNYSFAGLQILTNQEQNSVYLMPGFEADSIHTTDLRLMRGTPISIVNTDIDGDYRSDTLPFIGCDEHKIVNLNQEDTIHLCQGDSVKLRIAGGLSNYQWSTGSNTYYTWVKTDGFAGDTQIVASAIEQNLRFYDTVLVRVHFVYAYAGEDTSLCDGQLVDLIGQGNAKLRWRYMSQTHTGDTFTLYVQDTMEAILKVSDDFGCIAYDTAYVNGLPIPELSLKKVVRVCEYEPYTIRLINQPLVSYTWKINNLPDTISTDTLLVVDSSGKYTAILESIYGCTSSATQEVEIKQTPPKPLMFVTPNDSFCFGDSVFVYTNSYPGTYLWNGKEISDSGIFVNQTQTASVSLIERECHSDTSYFSVTEKNRLQKPVIVSPTNLKGCQGDSVLLTTANKYHRYQWFHGSKDDTVFYHSNGLTKVMVWDQMGCESPYSDVALINFYPKPLRPKITSSNGNNFCEGDSTILTGPGGYLYYVWSGNGIDTTEQRVAKSGGGYYLRVVDTNFCTSDASNKYSITLKPAPPVPQIQGDTILCIGTDIELMAIPNNLDKYYWDDGDTNRTRTLTNGGAFKVKAIGNNLCESEFSELHTVTEKQRPSKPTVESIGNDSLRSSLTAASYNWYLDNTNLNKHTRSILAMTTGDYEVALFEGGCESERSDVLYFIPSGIDENQVEAMIKVYPNPGNGLFFIETPTKYKGQVLRIYDMHGSLIKSATIQNTKQEVDLGDVAKGIYLVKVGGERIVLVVE
jgi:hypothetical protein